MFRCWRTVSLNIVFPPAVLTRFSTLRFVYLELMFSACFAFAQPLCGDIAFLSASKPRFWLWLTWSVGFMFSVLVLGVLKPSRVASPCLVENRCYFDSRVLWECLFSFFHSFCGESARTSPFLKCSNSLSFFVLLLLVRGVGVFYTAFQIALPT